MKIVKPKATHKDTTFISDTLSIPAQAGKTYHTHFEITFDHWTNQKIFAVIEQSYDKKHWFTLVEGKLESHEQMPNPTWISGSHISKYGGGFIRLRCQIKGVLTLQISGEVT